MINREEIDMMARQLSVRPADVQRDYINGWLLYGIYSASTLASSLVLKGGNALRKGFFQNTRYSNDLDFTAPQGIDKGVLKSEMLRVTHLVGEKTGVQFLDDRLDVVEPKRATENLDLLELRAYFLDFYGEKHTLPMRIYMDITEFDRVYLPPKDCALIHPYSDATSAAAKIRCVAVEEILASKLKCLLQRRKASDLFDYARWLMFDDISIDRSQVLSVFLRKTIYGRAPDAAFGLLIKLPFVLFGELWERHLSRPSNCVFSFESAVSKFKEHLSALFGPQQFATAHGLSFFPAELREPIMTAGRNQHLMRLTYDGHERTIEPYALKYLTRKDGVAREYFYAYDRTGGSSGQCSIKSFVADRVQSLVELDEPYEPRCEIEVSQAGEMPDNPHFKGRPQSTFFPGFGFTRAPRGSRSPSTRRSPVNAPKHRFRCPLCNKTFVRSEYDATLKPHKHPSGFQCAGSFGVYLGFR